MKHFFLGLLLIILLLPAVGARVKLLTERPLAGAFTLAPRPDFSWESLLAGDYQPALEAYVEGRVGLRNTLIRVRNQLAFSLFRVARSSDIVVGRHEVLFQPGPINSYRGLDLLDSSEVRFQVHRLRQVQDLLAQRGVVFLYALAPSKARHQPEDLPDYWQPAPGARTNYDLFARQLRADSVHLLDYVPLFRRWKATKHYPLFPRTGTHWSGYGASLAADTLLNRLAQLGRVRFPTIRELGPPRIVRATDSLRGNDNDLGWPLNLFWERETNPLAYRRLRFDPPAPDQARPSALLVGDSFTWGLMLFAPYIQRQFSDDTRFWYYNTSVCLPDIVYHKTGEQVASLNLRQQLESRRMVVLLLTENNLTENSFGFADQVYYLYHPFTQADWNAVGALAKKLESQATWEEASANPEQFSARMYAKAQRQYERSRPE